MKSKLLSILFCLLSYTLADNTYLIRTNFQKSLFTDFTVVHQSKSQCLVFAKERDLQKLVQMKSPYEVLVTNPNQSADDEYFVVYPDISNGKTINPAIFEQYGTVIDVFDQQVIMKGEAQKLLEISTYPIQLSKISMQSNVNPYRHSTVKKDEAVKADPLIEQLLSGVSPDSCARFLRDLCGIYNRYAGEDWNIDEVVPYIENKFLAYNCDSVFRLTVSGYDAPAIVGIRWGEVNPTLEQVCLIGAHPDTYCQSGGRHQGAWDNGCGNVGYLEAARTMKDFTFENTIIFAAFNSEEVGMLGSIKLVDELLDEGTQIIGGAITYDMLGIGPNTERKVSHTISTANNGGQEFADKMEELAQEYNLNLSVRTTESNDIPTDTKHFWQNGYVASCGKGGTNAGTYHTKADSISDIFDSTWLAEAVSPGIATIAYYAVPTEVNSISSNTTPLSKQTITVHNNSAGIVAITLSGSIQLTDQMVNIYAINGKLVKKLALNKNAENSYKGSWDCCNMYGETVGSGLYLISGAFQGGRFYEKVLIKR